jgi:hypothetical protein
MGWTGAMVLHKTKPLPTPSRRYGDSPFGVSDPCLSWTARAWERSPADSGKIWPDKVFERTEHLNCERIVRLEKIYLGRRRQ